MRREEIEEFFSRAGWRKTIGAPQDIVDYQTSKPFYNRIILFPVDFPKITVEILLELMSTRPGSVERDEVLRRYNIR